MDDVLRGRVRWAWVPIADRALCKVLPDRAAETIQDVWPWADGRCP